MRSIFTEAHGRLGCMLALVLSFALSGAACGATYSSSDAEKDTRDALGGKIKVLRWGVRSVHLHGLSRSVEKLVTA